MITIVDLAKEFALKHHRDQMYGDKPYEYHLNKVYEKVKKFGLGTDAEVVAWLHDVYEDCDISIVDIMDTFGENIATAVKAISNDVSFYNTLRNIRTNKLAKSVKICDRICNMEESVGKPIARKYLKQYKEFRCMLHIHDVIIHTELENAFKNLRG